MVIAENIDEFLSLGCQVGWFSLEQLVYNIDSAISWQRAEDPEVEMYFEENAEIVPLLKRISKYFDVKECDINRNRLDELNSKYESLLK